MEENNIFLQIKNDIQENFIVVYMKGTKHAPRCRFSADVVKIFNKLHSDFKDIDVLDNLELRQAIKEYNNWPTIPQVFIGGKFVGGCDITQELFDSGELQEIIDKNKQ